MNLKTIFSRLQNRKIAVQGRSAKEIFREIYQNNYWGNAHSRSGAGSDLTQTRVVREELPKIIANHAVASMLDIPCGDWHWMKEVQLNTSYIGADIVAELIAVNNKKYGNAQHQFMQLDIIKDELPIVDLIFARDVLVHLSLDDIRSALDNIKKSGSRLLLTTTFTERSENIDIPTGHWRPINLQRAPFNLPAPLLLINENCTEGDGSWGDKSLGLWNIADIT